MPTPITAFDEEELLSQLKGQKELGVVKPESPNFNMRKLSSNNNKSDSGNSSSPGLSKSGNKPIRNDANAMLKRRHRLSTISSDFFDENADSPRQSLSFRGRRKSSNFDMLCDPIKYLEFVNKYLDGIDEEEDTKGQIRVRKRTRSSTFMKSNPTYLP